MTGRILSRVPFADYQALPATNISALKELKRSPLHYRHALANPKTTPAMTLGTAAHCATLEPERFCADYVTWCKRTESGRTAPRTGKAWESFVSEFGDRTILTEDEAELAANIAAAVRGDPVAAKYLAAGEPEVVLEWKVRDAASAGDGYLAEPGADTFRRCKGRVDWLTVQDGEPVIVGLKTARDCRNHIFSTVAAQLGYGMQWAWYFNGYRAITGREARMVEIVVESKPPHAVVVYVITEDILARGREEYESLLRVLSDCEARGEWPGPAQTELVLSMPTWWYGSDEDISDLGLEE